MRRQEHFLSRRRAAQVLEVMFFPKVYRYLYPGEHAIYSQRRHVVVVVPWLLAATAAVIAAVGANVADVQLLQIGALPLLVVTVPLAVYHFVDWYAYRVFISDRRLVELKGLLGVQVNMMPLNKITDMAFDHTIPGLVLGYGKFRVESAGQDQALGTLHYMVNENLFYAVSTALSIDRNEGLNNLTKQGYLAPGTVLELIEEGILNADTIDTIVAGHLIDEETLANYLGYGKPNVDLIKMMFADGQLTLPHLRELIVKKILPLDLISKLLTEGVIDDGFVDELIDAGILKPV